MTLNFLRRQILKHWNIVAGGVLFLYIWSVNGQYLFVYLIAALTIITLALGVKLMRKPLGDLEHMIFNTDTLEAIAWLLVAAILFVWFVFLERSAGTFSMKIGLEVSFLTLAGVAGGLINRYNKDGH